MQENFWFYSISSTKRSFIQNSYHRQKSDLRFLETLQRWNKIKRFTNSKEISICFLYAFWLWAQVLNLIFLHIWISFYSCLFNRIFRNEKGLLWVENSKKSVEGLLRFCIETFGPSFFFTSWFSQDLFSIL